MSRSRTVVVLALAVLLLAAGCVSVGVRKAGSVVTGKKDSVCIISGHNQSFTEYDKITIARFTSDIGGETETLLGGLRAEAARQLEESKLFDGVAEGESAESGLIVRGRIIDYNAGTKWKRIATIGGEAFVIARFRIENAQGDLLAEFNSRGFIKDALSGGEVKDSIPLICEGLVNFLDERTVREAEEGD